MHLTPHYVLILLLAIALGCQRRADEPVTSDKSAEAPAQASERAEPTGASVVAEGEPSVPTTDVGPPSWRRWVTDERSPWVVESIGPLKINTPESEAARVLGAPKEKTTSVNGASGEYERNWHYEGVKVILTAENEEGPFVVGMVIVTAPSDWKTERGIGIGSSQQEVERAYAGDINPLEGEGSGPGVIVVGTIYDGIVIDLSDDKVSRIRVGRMAD